ncbi:hypothetical protein [Celeribacter litoreus]|uniref:hypothetical protein n=1 Tax=Celeribacter litoreus TaxID=2876714 RepID=UPI001CCCA927|nr:hypothetical protein [Celeribacter litoreus]MCA0044191.1 hypothetical protein [Celeribacter litoreus]
MVQVLESNIVSSLVYDLETGRFEEVTMANARHLPEFSSDISLIDAILAAEAHGYEVRSATLRAGAKSNLIVRRFGTEHIELEYNHLRHAFMETTHPFDEPMLASASCGLQSL